MLKNPPVRENPSNMGAAVQKWGLAVSILRSAEQTELDAFSIPGDLGLSYRLDAVLARG